MYNPHCFAFGKAMTECIFCNAVVVVVVVIVAAAVVVVVAHMIIVCR